MAAVVLAGAAGLSAHDLFLHPRGFFLGPGATITLPVIDGAFSRSTHATAAARLADLSLRGPGGAQPIDRGTWSERDGRSTVRLTVGAPGTHVVGVALHARTSGTESRAISAKTLLAVTDATGHLLPADSLRTRSTATQTFGYDAEIVPLVDPYALAVGDALPVEARLERRPLAGATLQAGGTIGTSATPIPGQVLTTDARGRATIRLTHDGHWFVSFVHTRAGRGGDGAATMVRCTTMTFGLLPAGAR